VDRLDEVAGAVGAEPGDARVVVELGSDRSENRLDAFPAFLGAADHDGGPGTGTLFTAGYAHADEGEAGPGELFEARDRVTEIGIAGIDHDVVMGEMRHQRRHLLVHGFTGLDHDDDRARRADGSDKLFDRMATDDLAGKVACF